MVLNFEYDKNGELKIFVDDEGSKLLINYFNNLITKKDTHYHLLSSSWGGYELTEEIFDENSELINQVRIQRIE
jgi:hypothetical protein